MTPSDHILIAWKMGYLFRKHNPTKNWERAMYKYLHENGYPVPTFMIKSLKSELDEKLDQITVIN